jgi:hypothetical protein
MVKQETVYFQEGGVTVTNARAILGSKTFAMANITSVSMHTDEPNKLIWILLTIFGLLFALIGFLPDSPTACWGMSLVLVAFSVFKLFTLKTKYSIVIGSASGETNALTSTNMTYIRKIVNAMNEAIVKRG